MEDNIIYMPEAVLYGTVNKDKNLYYIDIYLIDSNVLKMLLYLN